MLKGSIVALITPFDENNQIDYEELKKLLDFHVANQTDGLLLLGTTAEAESLTNDEKVKIVKYSLEHLAGKIPVMVGIISNNTYQTIELARLFENFNIDSFLVSAPYYVKSNTSGLIKHFTHIADNVKKPIVLYNVPKRSGINLDVDVVKILSYHSNIIGIKEASGDLAYQSEIASFCRNNFVLYGADDLTTLSSLGLGAVGHISVLGNAFPKEFKLILDDYSKDIIASRKTFFKLQTLCKDIFKEPSPIPIKYLLFLMGFKTSKLRLPLAEVSVSLRRKLEEDYLAYIS